MVGLLAAGHLQEVGAGETQLLAALVHDVLQVPVVAVAHRLQLWKLARVLAIDHSLVNNFICLCATNKVSEYINMDE